MEYSVLMQEMGKLVRPSVGKMSSCSPLEVIYLVRNNTTGNDGYCK